MQNIKRWSSRKKTTHPNEFVSLYDMYCEHDQKPWNIAISEFDRLKIERAISLEKSIKITPNLSDIQLLKLHAASFPEYDNQLVYHSLFNLYEVKYKKQTIHVFSYISGIYTPINNIF